MCAMRDAARAAANGIVKLMAGVGTNTSCSADHSLEDSSSGAMEAYSPTEVASSNLLRYGARIVDEAEELRVFIERARRHVDALQESLRNTQHYISKSSKVFEQRSTRRPLPE